MAAPKYAAVRSASLSFAADEFLQYSSCYSTISDIHTCNRTCGVHFSVHLGANRSRWRVGGASVGRRHFSRFLTAYIDHHIAICYFQANFSLLCASFLDFDELPEPHLPRLLYRRSGNIALLLYLQLGSTSRPSLSGVQIRTKLIRIFLPSPIN